VESYKSIETLYVRDPDTHALDLKQIRVQENRLINGWAMTEKIDGMNIRVLVTQLAGVITFTVKGRTDAAQLPAGVEAQVLKYGFDVDVWRKNIFLDPAKDSTVTVYGEAFGEGIQKNPLKLSGKRFRAFDILLPGGIWMSDDELRAVPLDIPTVPFLGLVTGLPRTEKQLNEITGGVSKVATEPVRPEGIVARPLLPLFDRYGNRVIWKLTYREFDKIRANEARAKAAEQGIVMAAPSTEVIKAAEEITAAAKS